MPETFDAVVTAGGRLDAAAAARFGTDVKALIRIGGSTMLEKAIAAVRGVASVARVVAVGPRSARSLEWAVDVWIDEFETGEENLMAGLGAARTPRVIFCASDLPFVSTRAIADFLSLVRESACIAYPIFEREQFLATYPGGRSQFLRLADGDWTGGSVLVVEPSVLRQRATLLRQVFRARKEPKQLTKVLGLALSLRYMAGRARTSDLEARAAQLLGKPVSVVHGADPSLAMDCDDAAEIDYALAVAGAGEAPSVL